MQNKNQNENCPASPNDLDRQSQKANRQEKQCLNTGSIYPCSNTPPQCSQGNGLNCGSSGGQKKRGNHIGDKYGNHGVKSRNKKQRKTSYLRNYLDDLIRKGKLDGENFFNAWIENHI